MRPRVSFVVPCYRLGHFLGECLDSVLAQTFNDFEVVVMDDCSPDNTPDVTRSYRDPRIRHVRNEVNLGHLKNYNKGISLCQSDYIWLVSADDVLCKSHVLQQYVDIMDCSPNAAYVFCAGVEIGAAGSIRPARYTEIYRRNGIIDGVDLFSRLLYGNDILASAGMVRKTVYQRFGMFPNDLPYAGDWYLWCLFAMHHDVAYLAEPMVGYRIHGDSMSDEFARRNASACLRDELAVLTRLYKHADTYRRDLTPVIAGAIAYQCARQLSSRNYRGIHAQASIAELDKSLTDCGFRDVDRVRMWGRIHMSMGDQHFQRGDYVSSQECYRMALKQRFWTPGVLSKYLLLRGGRLGVAARRRLSPHPAISQTPDGQC